MTKLRILPKPSITGQDKDDSTSAQGADVSSHPSATEDATDCPNVRLGVRAFPSRAKRVKYPLHLHPRHAESRPTSKSEDRPELFNVSVNDPANDSANESADHTHPLTLEPEVIDLDDGGYEGDAESHYPDAYEDVDNESDATGTSVATANASSEDESISQEMENLKVDSARHSRSESVKRYRKVTGKAHNRHKRTHSTSFDSLSSDSDVSHSTSSMRWPKQKRACWTRGPGHEPVDDYSQRHDDGMDLGE